MAKFKVGDRIVSVDTTKSQAIYTIKAIGDLLDNNEQGAWVVSDTGSTFGLIVNLGLMKRYFEPGFYQWRGWTGKDMKGPVKWHDDIFGTLEDGLENGSYVRVNVVPVEVPEEEEIEDDV